MLPDKISKFKSRIRSRTSSNTNLDSELESRLYIESDSNPRLYLHNRRRYLINSIPLLSIVALLVGISSVLLNMVINNSTCYAAASTSLTIDGGSSKTISETIAPNETKYVSSNVSYSATDTSAYTLKLTYANGSSALALDNGSSSDGSSGGSGGTSDGSTTTIPDVVNNTTGSDISNAWGYTWVPSNTPSSSYSTLKYNTIPAYGSSTNLETGTTISSTTKQLVFAANLSDSNPTGHYKTNLLLSLVATPATTTYTITYNANGGTGAPSSTTCTVQGAAGSSCTTTLSSTKPTRTNYTFLGWSTSSTSSNASYQAGGSITVSSDTTLWAVWTLTLTPGFTSITNMQQMTSSICSSAVVGAYKDLVDTRDNSTYRVVKFNDGKCWMTQDLRLAPTANKTLTSTDSNVSSNFTLPATLATLTDTDFSPSFDYNNKAQSYKSSTGNVYYNWYAATAGTGNADITTPGTNVSSSICPLGWTLPTGGTGTSTDFWKLFRNMGLTISNDNLASTANGSTNWGTGDLAKVQGPPCNLTYTGYVYNGSLTNTTYGYWWSRTAYSTSAYRLYFNSSRVVPGANLAHRYLGLAVRCVADTGGYDTAPTR